MLVSHDRHFLDQVVNQLWELEDAKLTKYSGNFSEYRQQKKIELKRKRKEYEKYQAEKKRLKKRIQKQQQFVNKADKGRKRTDSFWRQLKGSDSRTGQMAKRVKSLKTQIEQLDEKEKPFAYKKINPDFDQKELHNQIIIEGKEVSKRFSSETIFTDLDFSIKSDSKIALIGKNGIGKSLLLKIILGKEKLNKGKIIRSAALDIAYFSQKLTNLNESNTVLEEVKEKNPDKSEELIRTFLGSMLFRGEDVFKNIKDLSIGERVRVAFTLLLLSGANFLLLDEPLNHLDITSRERIEEALENYSASFLMVTHDRYFARNSVNEMWELSDKGLECFKGNYDQFLKYKKGEYKSEEKLKDDLIKMKRVQLLAQLEHTTDEEEIEKIENELKQL